MAAAERAEAAFSRDELNHLFRDLAGADHIALAVSGGSDSTALMLLVHAWARGQTQPPQVSVLTVDHGLRDGSGAEAEAVSQWTRTLGQQHAVLSWSGEKPSTRIQERARQARYKLLTQWCKENGAAVFLTAHTIEDQAETIVMRLARGTGIEGFAGMRRSSLLDGIILRRPLLNISRQRLRAYLQAQNHSWIDDPSNENSQFERIRVRKAWPEIERAGLTAYALHETAYRALRADNALHAICDDFIAAEVQRFPEGYCAVDLQSFRKLPDELRIRVLDRLTLIYGAGQRAELAALERLEGWVSIVEPQRKRATLAGCLIALRQKSILFGREPGRISHVPMALRGQGVWDGRWQISVDSPLAELNVRPASLVSGVPRVKSLPAFVQAGMPAIFDGEKPVFLPDRGQLAENLKVTATFCR